jgi:hypothetical protein
LLSGFHLRTLRQNIAAAQPLLVLVSPMSLRGWSLMGFDSLSPSCELLGLIVSLQDPDKISHAGSISVFSRSRNLSIGHGLASLPEPHEEIGDVSHGVLAAPNVSVSIS